MERATSAATSASSDHATPTGVGRHRQPPGRLLGRGDVRRWGIDKNGLACTLTATDGALTSATSNSFNVAIAPTVSSAATATFTVGTSSSATISTSADIPTNTVIAESGTLPTGVTLVDKHNGTATISGTPTGAAGSHPIANTAVASSTVEQTSTIT